MKLYTAPTANDDTKFLHLLVVPFLAPDLVPQHFVGVVMTVGPKSEYYTYIFLLDYLTNTYRWYGSEFPSPIYADMKNTL